MRREHLLISMVGLLCSYLGSVSNRIVLIKAVSIAYLSARLLHIRSGITVDQRIQDAAHSSGWGRRKVGRGK